MNTTACIKQASPHIHAGNILQHSQFSSQHNVSRPSNAFGSTPHLPRDFYNYDQHQPTNMQQQNVQNQNFQFQYRDIEQDFSRQFFLHDTPAQPQRRTWAQHAQMQQENAELRGWQVGRLYWKLQRRYYSNRNSNVNKYFAI